MSLLYATLLAGATFGWGYIFWRQEAHPQPFRKLMQIFSMGFLAVLPLLAYRYIYQNYLPRLAEYAIFNPLFQSPFLKGLSIFVLSLLILSLILWGVSGGLSLMANFFRHEVAANILRSLRSEELAFGAVGLMTGGMALAEGGAEALLNRPILGTALGTVLLLSTMEEYVKHLMVRFGNDGQLKNMDDAITFSIMVGLGFGVAETVIYVIQGADWSLMGYRALLSLPVHAVASGTFGYFYGLARFGKTKKVDLSRGRKGLHQILWLKRSITPKEGRIAEGLAFSALFHAAANLLFELNLAFLAVPLLAVGLMMIFGLYRKSHPLYRLAHD